MKEGVRVSLAVSDADALEKQIEAGLRRFNEAHVGPNGETRLVFAARDDSEELIGGLVAYVYWNYLYIDQLWVEEQFRHNGVGGALMGAAEAEARRRGLDGISLNTFSFSAPAFYRKLGYEQYGQLTGMPKGVTRHFFCKWL
jgi:GNAT superfamily N-acetyltransferase